jgi:hypothetical protein
VKEKKNKKRKLKSNFSIRWTVGCGKKEKKQKKKERRRERERGSTVQRREERKIEFFSQPLPSKIGGSFVVQS